MRFSSFFKGRRLHAGARHMGSGSRLTRGGTRIIIIPAANERVQRRRPRSGPQCAAIATRSAHDTVFLCMPRALPILSRNSNSQALELFLGPGAGALRTSLKGTAFEVEAALREKASVGAAA